MMTHPRIERDTVNRLAAEDAAGFIERTEREYGEQIRYTAEEILAGGQRIVMLAGPSGSGKTTTAAFLARCLTELGAPTVVVSLDDFYLSPQDMPLGEDGAPDFESVHSLDLAHLQHCLRKLVTIGRCELPVFDFVRHRIDGHTRLLELCEGDVVIFEGLHALNPLICDCLPAAELYRLYVHIGQDILQDGRVLLNAQQMRLVRRTIRDFRFRSSSPSNTLILWQGVMRGEEQYLRPYVHTAQSRIDSLHRYEPCVFRAPFLDLMKQVGEDDPYYALIRRVGEAMAQFHFLSVDTVPESSLLREFIGK